jgi:hypothetical protein
VGLCLCSAPFNLLKGKARTSETKTLEATMGDRDGGDDRGPGLDTTLQDSDIESNWDQVRVLRLSAQGMLGWHVGRLPQ